MEQKQAICLTMIVKNEAHVIKRCLDSVKPFITHWAIVDTGSTDGTQDIVRKEMLGTPGRLYQSHWTDFATERNRALSIGRNVLRDADNPDGAYLLTIDADEAFVPCPGFELPHLTADSYALAFRLGDTDQMWARRVFVTAQGWHWVGEIHEHLEHDGPYVNGSIDGLMVHSRTDGARSKLGQVEKARRDAKVCEKLVKRDPKNPRNWFYLAQSYAGAQQIDKAIRAYEKRLELAGFDEERYTAQFQIGCLREFRGDHIDDVKAAYLAAFNERPTRAEPMWAMAVLCNDRGQPALAEVYARAACRIPRPPDALIVSESIYLWRSADELAGALTKLGRPEEALKIMRRLVESPNLPQSERQRVLDNIATLEAESAPVAA